MKLVFAGDVINPCPPSFNLKIDDYTMGMSAASPSKKIWRIENGKKH
jgi:hypothetical protein